MKISEETMKDDYSDVVFDQGIVCMNKNNNALCVVINGMQGSPDDRCSLVIEFNGIPFLIHTPPNRALQPTGKIYDLKKLTKLLNQYVVAE
jgi:hypothetical protein